MLEKRIKVKDSIYLEVVADNRVDSPHAVIKVRVEPAADMDVYEHSGGRQSESRDNSSQKLEEDDEC